MSDKSEEKKEGEGDAAKPKKSKKKLIIIVAAVLVLALGGGGFFLMKGKPPVDEHATDEPKEEEVHLETLKLEPFIVNLSESTSFLKVTLLIEYNPIALGVGKDTDKKGAHGGGGEGEKGPSMPPIFAQREPMVRDTIIKVLSSRKAQEVLSPDGKAKLKEDLIEGINEALGLDEPAVTNIYFTEFIIQ